MAQQEIDLLLSQGWYIDKLLAVGFEPTRTLDGHSAIEGFCFGLSHMALHAFLANDLPTFNQRLVRINEMSIDAFKNNCEIRLMDVQTL